MGIRGYNFVRVHRRFRKIILQGRTFKLQFKLEFEFQFDFEFYYTFKFKFKVKVVEHLYLKNRGYPKKKK